MLFGVAGGRSASPSRKVNWGKVAQSWSDRTTLRSPLDFESFKNCPPSAAGGIRSVSTFAFDIIKR